jgi:hypothetical protein
MTSNGKHWLVMAHKLSKTHFTLPQKKAITFYPSENNFAIMSPRTLAGLEIPFIPSTNC